MLKLLILKRAVSPVVATALLLVVAVSAVVGFSGWISEFNSNLFVDVDSDSSSSSSVRVEGIFNDVLYLKSKEDNIKISNIKILDGKNNLVSEVDFDSIPINNPTFFMNFDNSTFNGTHVQDLSGNNYMGTLLGTPVTYTDDKCFSAECIRFYEGLTGRIRTNFSILTSPFSISVWINVDNDVDLYGGIISKYTSGPGDGIFIRQTDSRFQSCVSSVSLSSYQCVSTISNFIQPNKLYHYVATYDGSTLKVYIDSKFIGSISAPYVDTTTNLMIGSTYTSGESINATIDQVKIYDKELFIEDINQLYWENLKIIRKGINKIDLSTFNLSKGEGYNVLVGGDNGLIDVEVIPQ